MSNEAEILDLKLRRENLAIGIKLGFFGKTVGESHDKAIPHVKELCNDWMELLNRQPHRSTKP